MQRTCILMLPLIGLFVCSGGLAQEQKEDPLSKASELLSAAKPLQVTGLEVDPLSAVSPFADSAWVWREVYDDFPNGKKYHEWVVVFFKDGRYVKLGDIFSHIASYENRVAAKTLKEQGRWKTGPNGMVSVSEFVLDGKANPGTTIFKIQGSTLLRGRDERDFDVNSKYNLKRLSAKLSGDAMKSASNAKWK